MLNYLYAVLEAEARLAAAALGLDPGFGFLHLDTKSRDSLACDLMEPIRPRVDAYVLGWLLRQPLKREWFFEMPDGNCRLMAPFAEILSETAATWAREVAPIAESVVRALWQTLSPKKRKTAPPTRLTQRHRREVKGATSPALPLPKSPMPACRECGAPARRDTERCGRCEALLKPERMAAVARIGRQSALTPSAQARRSQSQIRHNQALRAWNPDNSPPWLSESFYRQKIHPLLATVSTSLIAQALGVSLPYAAAARVGKRVPHPRHWEKLAKMVGVDASS